MEEKSKIKVNYLLFLVLIFFMGIFILIALVRKPVQTELVQEKNIIDTIRVEGIVIRNETVLTIDPYRPFQMTHEEGERVQKDSSVGYYVTEESKHKIDKINELEERIKNIENTKPDIVDSIDLNTVEKDIMEKTVEIKKYLQDRNAVKAKQLYKELNDLVAKKYSVLESWSEDKLEVLAELKQEKLDIEAGLSDKVYVAAPISGVVSKNIDGLESQLNTNKDFLVNDWKNIIETLNQVKEGDTEKPISQDIKIEDNHRVIIGIPLAEEQFKEVSEKGALDIIVNNNYVECKVDSKAGDQNSKIVYLATKEDNIDVLLNRYLTLDIVLNNSRGLAVPTKSLIEKDGVLGVYLAYSGRYKFAEVTVVAQNEEIAIVEGLKQWDEVVTNPAIISS